MPPRRKVALPRSRPLNGTVAYEQDPETGEQVRVTVRDVIIAGILRGSTIADATAAAGISMVTLRTWRRQGQQVLTEVADGKRTRSDLSRDERALAHFVADLATAEATAKANLVDLVRRLAEGGAEISETVTTVTVDQQGQPLSRSVTEKRSVTAPDLRAATWLLERRWPGDFGRKLEVTGADGGPLVDPTPAIDRARELLADLARNRAATTPDAIEAKLARPPELGPPKDPDPEQ